jgi:hypothetical protein
MDIKNLPYHKILLFDNNLHETHWHLWGLRMCRFVSAVADPGIMKKLLNLELLFLFIL